MEAHLIAGDYTGFNTASGKYCCNWLEEHRDIQKGILVSIPQAVSTVATCVKQNTSFTMSISSFNTASGKYCCNIIKDANRNSDVDYEFQYRKR